MTFPEPVQQAIDAGFNVIPADMDKHPKTTWKQWQDTRQAEADLELLGHGNLWAIITGEPWNVVVLDFDGDEGLNTMRDLGLAPTVRTATGAHVYVTHPGHPVKSSAKAFPMYPGLDIKGDKSIAFFHGHSKKGSYEAVEWPPFPVELPADVAADLFPEPSTDPANNAPVGEYTGYVPEAERYLRRVCDDIRTAPRGSSNAALNKAGYAVGGLIAAGQLDDTAAYLLLLEAAEERGAGTPEVVLRSALNTGAEKPWKLDPVTPEDEWIPSYAIKMLRSKAVPEPVEFPIGVFPEPLQSLIIQGSKSVSCPADYIGTALLPALGLAIGGNITVDLLETWIESPLIWAAIVGPPGTAKTPAIKLVMRPAKAAEQAYEDAAAAANRRAAEDGDDSWVEVQPARLLVDDATIEGLFGVHESNPRGLLLAPDELTGWVSGMGQYKGGGGRDRQHWLSIWSRGTIRVDRAKSTNRHIRDAFVAVVGGIQPEPLEELIHGADDGLVPRLLLAQGTPQPRRFRRGVLDPAVVAAYEELWNRLRDNGTIPRKVEFTDDGILAFETWSNAHNEQIMNLPPELRAAWSKMDAQCARIALILAEVDESDITEDHVARAVALVRYYQGQAAALLRGSITSSKWEKQNAARTKAVARLIQDNPGADRGELLTLAPEWALDIRNFNRHLEALKAAGLWHGEVQ